MKKIMVKIKEFLKLVKLPFEDMDFYNPEEVVNYSMKLKSHKDDLLISLDENNVKMAIEDFLKSHNTCTLATCHSDKGKIYTYRIQLH